MPLFTKIKKNTYEKLGCGFYNLRYLPLNCFSASNAFPKPIFKCIRERRPTVPGGQPLLQSSLLIFWQGKFDISPLQSS